ncbi:MAG: DUF488 domain-containing protein [Campylobacteraceae bacterium]|nr:DUF488 domain-containing protein [Campylobacteraceae bacterium]
MKNIITRELPTYKRQRLALALLESSGAQLSKIDFQKLLFLYVDEQQDKSYDFVPYMYGCYSFQANNDMNTMRQYGFLSNAEIYEKKSTTINFLDFLDKNEQIKLKDFSKRFNNIRGKELISHVYNNFPYFAINSKIADEHIDKQIIKSHKPYICEKQFFTIGYEGKSIESFINNLIKNDVRILVDVRKNALSMKFGFSKAFLANTLEKINIKYIHIPSLGIASEERKNLKTKEDYAALFDIYKDSTLKYAKKDLEQLLYLYDTYDRMAIMCYEKDVNMCHRGCIATKINTSYKLEIRHI